MLLLFGDFEHAVEAAPEVRSSSSCCHHFHISDERLLEIDGY